MEEGRELRKAGISAPVLLLSEPPQPAMADVVAYGLTPTIYSSSGLDAIRAAAHGSGGRQPVHVKVDTGMHRVGASPDEAVALAAAVDACGDLELEGFWTHFVVSDEVERSFTSDQISLFRATVESLARRGVRPRTLHAANSAGAIWHPDARFDMVRCGIAIYGLSPGLPRRPALALPDLRPVMSLKARVSYVKRVGAGERISYGLRYQVAKESVVATVPLGYADGVTRSLSERGGEVLLGGRRHPIAGTVTMDQILVDCGPDSDVEVGDEVVLLGAQSGEVISAWEWAERVGSIAYEVVCGISGRVPRHYLPEPGLPARPGGAA